MARFATAMAVVVLVAGAAALASQADKRLDALSARLTATESETEAAELTRQIWFIWLQSENDVVNALMAEGIAAMSHGHYHVALAAFDKVVEIEPDLAEGWNKRATIYYLMGDYAAAVRDVEQTLALEPRHFGALSGLGLIYLAVGEDLAALKAFQAALNLNPHLRGAHRHVEQIRRRLRRNSI